MSTPSHKTCTKCGEGKSLEEFYKHKTGKYGRSSRCKPCKLDDDRSYYYRNLEKKREYERLRYSRDGDKRREAQRRYNAKYNTEVRERDRSRYARDSAIVIGREKKTAKEKNDISKSFQTVAHKHWTQEEDRLLMDEDGRTIYQKAVSLGRSYHGARWRHSKLKKEMDRVST